MSSNITQLQRFLRSVGACVVGTLLVSALAVLFNDGFGARDLWVFSFWSFPFALTVGGLGVVLTKQFGLVHLSYRCTMFVLCGTVIGILWTIVVTLLMGAWFMAFSFPVLFCWIAGGISGTIVVVNSGATYPIKKTLLYVLVISSVCLTASILANYRTKV